MGELSLFFTGALASCALIYTAPAALPEKNIRSSVRSAFITSLSLACAFLLTDAVRVVSKALWGSVEITFLLCVFFSFIFAKSAQWAFMPNIRAFFLPACTMVLVLVQPDTTDAVESVMYAIGTAAGVIMIITALSPVMKRIALSDAPKCVKGTPAALLILGLGALAFGGF